MSLDRAAEIAKAVLYEGYILYPYRPSSVKNRQRWTFGGVFPKDYAVHDASESCTMQTECLLRGDPAATIEVRVRFLHLVTREVGALHEPAAELPPESKLAEGEPPWTKVAALDVDGKRYVAWEEAVERQAAAPALAIGRLVTAPAQVPFAFAATREVEPIRAADGRCVGALVRTGTSVQGTVEIAAEQVADAVFRLTVRIINLTPLDPAERLSREATQRSAFVSTHTLLGVSGGEFLSLLDPPEGLGEAASRCANVGTWPVLAGVEGQRQTMLSSPIILYDYPQIAPESPGDLFDGTEIDEILTLRILTMTEEEKREMGAVDEKVRALLARTEALTPAELGRMHGTLRRPGSLDGAPVRDLDGAPLRDAGPKVGDQVRLHPKRRADIMDVVLKGKVAVIEAVERDFEDRVHVAVTLLDDPGRDLGMDRMPGHRFFFSQDEIEPLGPGAPAPGAPR